MNERIERAMQMQAAMVIMDRAATQNKSIYEVYRDFRKSRTFAMLFDYGTSLWTTGPAYISEEYDLELKESKTPKISRGAEYGMIKPAQ